LNLRFLALFTASQVMHHTFFLLLFIIDFFGKKGYFINSLAISKFLTRREMFLMANTYMVVLS